MNSKEYKQAKDLPIYSAVWKLLTQTDEIMNHMRRDCKHTFGQHILNKNLELLQLLSVAFNKVDQRIITIQEFLDRVYEIEMLIKFCSERGYLEQKYYVQAMPLLSNISRQAGGWLKKTQEEKSQSPSGELGEA